MNILNKIERVLKEIDEATTWAGALAAHAKKPVKSRKKVSKEDKSSEWRGAFIDEYSEPMKGWIRKGTITIKPGVSIKKLEAEESRKRKVKVRIEPFGV